MNLFTSILCSVLLMTCSSLETRGFRTLLSSRLGSRAKMTPLENHQLANSMSFYDALTQNDSHWVANYLNGSGAKSLAKIRASARLNFVTQKSDNQSDKVNRIEDIDSNLFNVKPIVKKLRLKLAAKRKNDENLSDKLRLKTRAKLRRFSILD